MFLQILRELVHNLQKGGMPYGPHGPDSGALPSIPDPAVLPNAEEQPSKPPAMYTSMLLNLSHVPNIDMVPSDPDVVSDPLTLYGTQLGITYFNIAVEQVWPQGPCSSVLVCGEPLCAPPSCASVPCLCLCPPLMAFFPAIICCPNF